MKFGKQIQSQQIPGWAPFYVDYKGLKKIINSLAKGHQTDAALIAAGFRPPFAHLSDTTSSASFIPSGAESTLLQEHKAAFFYKLERELEKINEFYLKREAELNARMSSLIEKRKILQARFRSGKLSPDSSSFTALYDGFRSFEKDLNKLETYIEMNATGFRKILKKWDKRSKSQTKELYLARQVDVQPVFNRELVAKLSDMAASNILKLDAIVSQHTVESELVETETVSTPMPKSQLDADIDMLHDLESNLSKALVLQSAEAVAGIILPIQNTSALNKDTQIHLQRVLWNAALSEPENSSSLIPEDRLDFSFVDDINDKSCLQSAAVVGNLRWTKRCVQRGANIGHEDISGRQALHYAAMSGNQAVVALLLDQQADPNALDLDGYSPVIYAIIHGHTQCVNTFITRGMSFSEPQTSSSALLPLSLASQHGHVDIVKTLLVHDAPIAIDASGLYPQHLAAREGHKEVLQVLLAARAEVDAIDKYSNWTPLFHAASEGHQECVEVLLEAHASVEAADETGKTAVHFAAWKGHVDIVDLLLRHQTRRQLKRPTPPPKTSDIDLDGDQIPSLSLPPPMIPFRIYGHNYLDNRSLVQISLGSSPVRLYNQDQLSSMKLVMDPQNDKLAISHTIILPGNEECEIYPFQVSSLDTFVLTFELYPTFGSQIIGKAVLLPSTLVSSSRHTIALLDTHLKHIGEVTFDVSIVKPFKGVQLSIGGRGETYWKSTGASGLHSKSKSAVITGSSLGGKYTRVPVQVTKDGVPVVWDAKILPVEGFELRVADVTESQFEGIVRQQLAGSEAPVTLQTLLEQLHPTINVTIDLVHVSAADINMLADSILSSIHSTESRTQQRRQIIISTADQQLATVMNWKQPNYPVFFKTTPTKDSTSIGEAVKFARSNNLLGVMLDGALLTRIPSLKESVRNAGLLLVLTGANSEETPSGVDGWHVEGHELFIVPTID